MEVNAIEDDECDELIFTDIYYKVLSIVHE